MKLWSRLTVLVGASLIVGSAFAQTLSPGKAAPAITVKEWIKGSKIAKLEPNKIYVVEFWATWCGPCIQSIPHLTEVAHKYKGKVTFLGVSIWEGPENVKPFVEKMGSKMDYNVAYGGNQEGMSVDWMRASGQNGIPTAFIVKDGVVQWIGHPMELEQPLEEVVAGKFDLAKHQADFAKKVEEAKKMNEMQQAVGAAQQLRAQGKKQEAWEALDKIEKSNPEAAAMMGLPLTRLEWLCEDDPAKAEKTIAEMASTKKRDELSNICMFALNSLQPKAKTAELGEKAMSLALANGPEEFMVQYFGQLYYGKKKDYKAALACVTKALEVLPQSEFKDNKDIMKQIVDDLGKQKAIFEEALKKGGN